IEYGRDVTLGRGEAGNIGVRRIGQEQVDPGLAQASKSSQVGDSAVERKLVHLEVAGVYGRAGAGLDRNGEGIGDRVVDRDELAFERPEVLLLACLDHIVRNVLQAVLAKL